MHPSLEQADTTERHSVADKAGLPPGSLVHVGEKHEAESKISVTQFNIDRLLQHNITSITELNDLKDNSLITWINIDGLSDTNIVEGIGKALNIHTFDNRFSFQYIQFTNGIEETNTGSVVVPAILQVLAFNLFQGK